MKLLTRYLEEEKVTRHPRASPGRKHSHHSGWAPREADEGAPALWPGTLTSEDGASQLESPMGLPASFPVASL